MKIQSKRILSFQGIRGIAIIMIMISHCAMTSDWALDWMGKYGVELFFILSGYMAMKNHKSEDTLFSGLLKAWNSIKKIYSVYLLAFVCIFPVAYSTLYVGNNFRLIKHVIINLCMMQSWIPDVSIYYGFNSVSWYLSTYFLCV